MGRKDREARVAFAGGVGGTEGSRWGKPEGLVGREETKGSRAASGKCCHAAKSCLEPAASRDQRKRAPL